MGGGGVRKTWEAFARIDPEWSILLTEGPRRGRWETEDFLATGEAEIGAAFALLDALGITVARGSALDFGCGVGRLTKALASRFEWVVGVDIAQGMIDRARSLWSGCGGISFMLQDVPGLKQIHDASFDFVYSSLVLQHNPPTDALGYVSEFFRVTKPGGAVVFQLPSQPLRPWREWAKRIPMVASLHWKIRARDIRAVPMPIHGVPVRQVIHCIQQSGGVVRESRESMSATWKDCVYVCIKPTG